MSTESAIAIRNLNYSFGKGALCKPVLIDVNLDIYTGEIVILTGPSGSGKTTLLTLIGALRKAQLSRSESLQEGSLKVLGQELYGASKKQLVKVRSQIGFIFQAHNLLECLSAQQNVRMSLCLHEEIPMQERTARCVAMLEAVGLGNRLDYYPDNLSGGQKQRVALAKRRDSASPVLWSVIQNWYWRMNPQQHWIANRGAMWWKSCNAWRRTPVARFC